MRIKTKLTAAEFTKLMFILTYRNPVMIILSAAAFLNVVWSILCYSGIYFVNPSKEPPYIGLVFSAVILVYIPVMTYRRAKRSYDSSQRTQENITYEFSDDKFIMTGETFDVEKEWANTYKINELNGFFMIHETPQIANIISKKNLTADECNAVSSFLQKVKANNPGIK
jgi:hypothetical protein